MNKFKEQREKLSKIANKYKQILGESESYLKKGGVGTIDNKENCQHEHCISYRVDRRLWKLGKFKERDEYEEDEEDN